MKTIELRNKWRKTIDTVDDRFIRMIEALYQSYSNEDTSYNISDEHKKILDQRIENHKTNPTHGRNWNDVKTDLTTKYGI